MLDDDVAERSVLGSVLLDPAMLPGVRRFIGVEDFSLVEHAILFDTVCRMADSDEPVDAVTLADALCLDGGLERIGGVQTIYDVLETVPSAANAEAYARIVKRFAVRRGLLALGDLAKQRAKDLTTDIAEGLAAVGDGLAALEAKNAEPAHDGLAEVVSREIEAAETNQRLTRWPCGVPDLDDLTGGLMETKVWVVGGKSKHCKTALAVTATNATLEAGHAVLHVRYEEVAADIVRRLVSQRVGLPWADQQLGHLGPDERAEFVDGLRTFGRDFDGRLHFLYGAMLPAIEHAVVQHKPKLVVVDTLQKMAHLVASRRGGERHDLHVGAMTAWLGSLAMRHDCCVMVVSQIGRAAGNACPSSAHLRESASIEEDADVVVLCWWAHIDRPDVDPDRYVLAVAKNRQGGRRERRVLDIDPHTQVLRPIPIEEQERFLDLAK